MRYQFLQLSNITSSTFDAIRVGMKKAKDVKVALYKLSSVSSTTIEGVFIVERIRRLTVTKEDGSTEDIKVASFERKSFQIDLNNKSLVVWNYGYSAQPLIKSIASLSSHQLAIEPVQLNIQSVRDWLYEMCSSITIQTTITQPLTLPEGGLIRLEVSHQQNINAISSIENNWELGKLDVNKQVYKCCFQNKPLTFSVLKKGSILIDNPDLIEHYFLANHHQFILSGSSD